ncbi:MAG TPA: hypothetical protein VNV62_15580 [Trebonia sp.]|jgi:hypothetical protein|nr:hypothetical protein [Trebonia sp.]
MKDSRRPRRRFGTLLAALTALGGTLVALAATGTAAMASIAPPPDMGGSIVPPGPSQAQVTPALAGGMPGWEITLIAIGAALVAAVLAVLADRARSARRRQVTAARLADSPARVAGSV